MTKLNIFKTYASKTVKYIVFTLEMQVPDASITTESYFKNKILPAMIYLFTLSSIFKLFVK